MDFSQFATASFMLIGLVNGVGMLADKQWLSFAKFTVAVVAGGLFGYLHMFGLPGIEMGLAIGMGSSGVYKALGKINGY
jgi:hypothetical protein